MWEEGLRIYGTLGVPNNFPANTILDLDFLKVWCNRIEICPFQVMFEAINFVKQ